MSDIKQIPLNELIEDYQASAADVALCELAQVQGITGYSGGSVQQRLEVNQQIMLRIEAELKRREDELHQLGDQLEEIAAQRGC